MQLRDANGNTVTGKTISLTANAGSHAVITPVNTVTTVHNGAAVFKVKNASFENVTFTATDTTDGIVLVEDADRSVRAAGGDRREHQRESHDGPERRHRDDDDHRHAAGCAGAAVAGQGDAAVAGRRPIRHHRPQSRR